MSGAAKRIEQLAPELERIISMSEPIHDLADGLAGRTGRPKDRLWWKEGRYLLFSDIHNNRRMKYVPGAGVTVFPGADEPGQWADQGPAGQADRLRT